MLSPILFSAQDLSVTTNHLERSKQPHPVGWGF